MYNKAVPDIRWSDRGNEKSKKKTCTYVYINNA